MEYRKPESMDECVYFTNRKNDFGRQIAWVFRVDCPECGEGKMGKPKKDGGKSKRKTRSKKYVCDECGYESKIEEFEDDFELIVEYECAACGYHGMAKTEYKRSSYKGTKSYKFECEECGLEIPISKKMKDVDKKVSAKEKLGVEEEE